MAEPALKTAPVEEIVSELRQGRRVLLVDDGTGRGNEGVVAVAAEHCSPEHITFMARRARGLVCLGLTEARCEQLSLPLMVERENGGERARFTLSIEAARGIDTGISAADRAHTVKTAVAPHAVPEDIVQPGHIFPVAVAEGGVLTRAAHAEAAVDCARLAGLIPAAVFADVLTLAGEVADAVSLTAFAGEHGLRIGSIADLIRYRLLHEQTIECFRRGQLETVHGRFELSAYRDRVGGGVHIALHHGAIRRDVPTLVRVHAAGTLRDLLGTVVPGRPTWGLGECLQRVAAADAGVVILLARLEGEAQLLFSLDLALGGEAIQPPNLDSYSTVGIGSQILRDLGVGKIRLMGAPIKYNAISGFGLEVVEFLAPESAAPATGDTA